MCDFPCDSAGTQGIRSFLSSIVPIAACVPHRCAEPWKTLRPFRKMPVLLSPSVLHLPSTPKQKPWISRFQCQRRGVADKTTRQVAAAAAAKMTVAQILKLQGGLHQDSEFRSGNTTLQTHCNMLHSSSRRALLLISLRSSSPIGRGWQRQRRAGWMLLSCWCRLFEIPKNHRRAVFCRVSVRRGLSIQLLRCFTGQVL